MSTRHLHARLVVYGEATTRHIAVGNHETLCGLPLLSAKPAPNFEARDHAVFVADRKATCANCKKAAGSIAGLV